MALGAQRASPCAPGRRRARIALEKRSRCRCRLRSRPLCSASRWGYPLRNALQLRTQCPLCKLHAARYSRGRSARWRTQGAAAAPVIATRFMCSGN